MSLIESIITQLRVPDLPYPVSYSEAPASNCWHQQLAEAWAAQSDDSVVEHLRALDDTWSVRQVNAAYLADRIMNVFLRKSGLHPVLTAWAARMRFWLALELEARGPEAVSGDALVRRWLDSLEGLKGWSRTGSRSDRWVLDHLAEMERAISAAFRGDGTGALQQCVEDWLERIEHQRERARKVQERLWQTETGAAGQRAAENAVRAALGRTGRGRQLPQELIHFVEQDWRLVMRRIVLEQGLDSEAWRHAYRLLEWLVWVGDPHLSDQDRNRLYQVGEQLVEKLSGLVHSVTGEKPANARFEAIDRLLVARLREQPLTLVSPEWGACDPRWLEPPSPDLKAEAASWAGQWYVQRHQDTEVRQYFFGLLPDTGEVLWTNEQGVKLLLQPFSEVRDLLEAGQIHHLPPSYRFDQVLTDTLSSLQRVLESQQKQREQAVIRAREQAEALKRQQDEAEAERVREQQRREQEAAAERERVEAQAHSAQQEADRAEREAREREVLALVDTLEAGSWVELTRNGEKQKLKLALRIRASGKLVFVDRLGLNRCEMNRLDVAQLVMEGQARVLSGGAEFEETLSRVVGRLRVGR